MGQAPTEAMTMTEIEATRRRLDTEFAELETYLTPTAEFMKRAAAIAGGVLAALAFLRFALRKRAEMQEARRLRSIDERLERLEELLERSAYRRSRAR
jgi:hypothetical protein